MTNTPLTAPGSPLDFDLELAAGRIPGKSIEIKFGERDSPAVGVFDDIWEGVAGAYAPPTEARLHSVASTVAADAGALVSSGTITTASTSKIIDLNATFIADSVAVGDLVLNDTAGTHSVGGVVSIDSEIELTIEGMVFAESGLEDGPNSVGDAYRVARPASTGASVVLVVGLDVDWLQVSEFVILNGLSTVATTVPNIRQYRMAVLDAGSANENAGTITSTAQIDSTVSCLITPAHNQSLMAIYTIPANKRGYIKSWNASISRKVSATAAVHMRTGRLDGVGRVRRHGSIGTSGQGGFISPFGPLVIPEKTDVWMQADVDTTNSGVTGGFRIDLEDI